MLERPSHGNRGGRKHAGRSRRGRVHGVDVEPVRNVRELLQERLHGAVLARLQVRVRHVVHRVQLLRRRARLARSVGRQDVRVDRLLPRADTREGVRRHVQRVRRRRRDLRVAARRAQRVIGQRRHVVAVDDVVRDARMIGLLGVELLEDRPGLQLIRVRLVGRLRGGRERQRVEDRRLAIGRILRGQIPHRLRVRDDARALIDRGEISVELRRGGDVAPLALRLGGRLERERDGVQALLELRRRPHDHGERIAPPRERDAPVRDRARGIRRERRLETLDGLTELEGVQQRHGAVELRLRCRRARRLEMHGPELLGRVLVVLGDEGCREQGAGRRQPSHSPKNRVHCGPPLSGRDRIIAPIAQ